MKRPYGSTVIPNPRARAMMGGGGGPSEVTVRLEINSGGGRLDKLLVEVLRKSIKDLGGDVQVVLGQ